MSFRKLTVLLACFSSGILAFAQTSTTAPAKDPRIGEIVSQLEAVRAPRQAAISPDSKWVAWVVRALEGHGSVIEAAPVDNPSATFQITACSEGKQGDENEIAWSPDSTKVAFFSDCNSEHQQGLYIAEPSIKTPAKRLTTFHGYADSPQWSPDGKFIGLLYVEGATRPSGALAAMKPPSGVIGVEGLEIQRVAAVDATSGELSQITPANLHVYEFNWSPQSSQIAYVAAPPPGENNWWIAKLYTETLHGHQPMNSDQPKVLVDPTSGHSPIFGLQIAVPRWSPNGSQIAFISGLMSDQGSTGGDIYIVPPSGGEPKDVTPGRKASPAWFLWIDEHTLGISEIAGGSSHLFAYDLNTQQDDDENSETFPEGVGSGQQMMSVSVSGDDHQIALIRSSFGTPPEVWAGTLHDLKQITHYNDNLKPAWGKAESVSWQSEGYDVQGWLIQPANYDPSKKYPLIVMVHGGPSAAVTPRWPGAGFGGAPFSALGYFVLEPNPRGSYGQGEKFTQANRKDFGYGDLRDILAGVDTVTKKYSIDPQRVGITGWSYGGFMTMFAVTQTTRFRAAVAGAGIANWQSYYGENSIDQWMIPFFGASVYDDPAVYAKSSAINFIRRVKTPTLVVVGDRDGECPMPQSFEFWHALRDEHVPTELVVYPNEGHHFASRDHQVDVLERALSWFEQYMPAQ
ncbi:S9 family peptidase [Alloacidobacterium sp.]|uniref:S9 family peptidase n=1 Tax=Alloacidobacterium sp. TaxID=2951999 RepID=UPI002D514184|nr:S9 family peptidase [Alloacidobacterium sp.]HYK35233.1 S9 family peptidase [Alloacidobacterium sp.]